MSNINFQNNQDWIITTLRKKSNIKKKQIQIDPTFKKMNNLDNATETIIIKKISDNDKKLLISLRIIKKISQIELAKQLNIKKETIRDIENGSYPENKLLFNKIKNHLMIY